LSQLLSVYTVETDEVRSLLRRVKLNKSVPTKFSKNYQAIEAPVAAIINSSLPQSKVPNQWKISRITLLPKFFPPVVDETDKRPVVLTNAIFRAMQLS